MSYDWHAAFRISGKGDADALIRREDVFREVRDLYGQLRLLSQVQALTAFPDSDWAKEREHYRKIVHRAGGTARYSGELIVSEQRRLNRLGLLWPRLDARALEILPPGSFGLRFRFILEEPFVSKDDAPFYPHDNPLRKEWALKVPMLGGSGWKGNLRAAMRWQKEGQEDDDLRLMFGPPRPEGTVPDGYFRAGRLRFYPTYFDAVDLEMLNPHDRESGSGRNPFNLECVPAGGRGVFSLLYVPFDRAGLAWEEYRVEVARHLKQVATSLNAMFRTLGFSAKRTSGFGLAAEVVEGADGGGEGTLTIHAGAFREEESEVEPTSPVETGPPPRPDGIEEFMMNGELPILGKSELRDQPWGKKKVSRYKRVRNAYLKWKAALEAWEEQSQDVKEEGPVDVQVPPPLRPLPFASFTELLSVADRAAGLLEVSNE